MEPKPPPAGGCEDDAPGPCAPAADPAPAGDRAPGAALRHRAALADLVPFAVIVTGPDGRVTWANAAAAGGCAATAPGRTPAEVLGMARGAQPADRAALARIDAAAAAGQTAQVALGGPRALSVAVHPQRAPDGRPDGCLIVAQPADGSGGAPDPLGRLIEDSLAEIYVFDARTLGLRQVTRGARENLGFTAAELAGMTPCDLMPALRPDALAALIAPLRSGARRTVSLRARHRRRDASTYPVEVRLQRIDGPDPAVMATVQDLTARTTAEAEASTARGALAAAVESLPDGFLLLDRDDRLVLCNERYREILGPIAHILHPGVRFADILRAGLEHRLFPEAEGREDAWLAENLIRPPPEGHAFEVALSDGRCLRIVERPTPDGGRVGLRIDITAQVESRRRAEAAEAAAQLARAQLLSAVEALPDGFILFDADDRLVMCNARLRALYPGMADVYVPGTRFGALLRHGLARGLFRDTDPDPDAWLAARLAERAQPAVSRVQRMASGQVLRVIDRAMPDGGRVGLRIDITELVAARRELADMIEGADAGTFRADLDTGALAVNDRWAAMLGHSGATLGPMDLGRLRALTHPEDRARLARSLLGGVRHGDGLAIELRLRHRDGRDVWALMRARVTGRDAQGRARSLAGLTLDITGRRRREGILQAVASAAERILGGGDWLAERATMLAEIGRAADVDRSYFFALDPPVDPALPDTRWTIRQEVEWCRDGIAPQMGTPEFDTLEMADAGLTRMQAAFRVGQPFVLHSRAGMTDAERAILEPQGVEALSLHPVMEGRRVAGFLGFDLCRPDPAGWSADAIDALTAAAHICSAALETAAAQARLREARDRAEAASRSKSDFLATMSHEIRTPLNGVLGIAELLESTVTEPEQHRMLGIIRHSGQTLLALLNDLLDMSRIEAGRLALEQAPFRPAAIAERLRDIHALAAADKGLAFDLTLDPGSATPRLGDAHRVQQILHNLLGNAVKFTETGGVRLTLRAPAGGPLVMAVHDTGIGMSEAEQARIFDSFTQADTSISRRYGGSGLGMTIVRRLVDLMGGAISVDSAPGAGTTVTVDLPLPPAGTAPSPALPAAPPADLAGLRVLAADDNAANRFLLHRILARLGIEAVIVPDGAAAVAAARAGGFDAILLDISMPGLDGPGALRAIRAGEQADRGADRGSGRGAGGPPILAVTANAMADQVADYLAQGFAAHVAKPFGVEDLRRALAGVVAPAR